MSNWPQRAEGGAQAAYLLSQPLLAPLLVGEGLSKGGGLVVEALIDKVAVHVGAEEIRAYERAEAKALEVLAGDELVVIVHRLLAPICAFLQFLRKVVQERAPPRGGPEAGRQVHP